MLQVSLLLRCENLLGIDQGINAMSVGKCTFELLIELSVEP